MASPSLLGWSSCIFILLASFLVCSCLKWGTPLLDGYISPGEVRVCDAHSFERRLHNHSEIPQICANIIPTDVVANSSVAQDCVTWCHLSLGPGSALPYAFSPVHWLSLRLTNSTVQDAFIMCWKSETAACALSWMPQPWHMYLAALMYGSVSGIALVRYLWVSGSKPEEQDLENSDAEAADFSADGFWALKKVWEAPEGQDDGSSLVSSCESGSQVSVSEVQGPWSDGFHEDGPAVSPFAESKHCKMPFCCIPISSDLEGAKCELRLSAFLMLFEPSLDVLSVLIFLRSGQPIYAAIVGVATALSWALARDPFQIRGAAAMAESFSQGFPTKELLRHRKLELLEGAGATIVQCYALLNMDISSASLSSSITLSASAGLSLALSLPDTCRAVCVLVENAGNDYYAAEQSKRRLGFFGRYIVSFLCMMFAELAVLCKAKHFWAQFSSLVLVPLHMSWSDARTWELWLIATVLLLFRSAVLGAVPLACCGLLLSIQQGWISSAFS